MYTQTLAQLLNLQQLTNALTQSLALFAFDGSILEGELPNRDTKFVQEWLSEHRAELEENWHKAQNGEPLNYIALLE